MLEDSVVTYIKKGSSSRAFFYIVGNEEYGAAIGDLKASGFEIKNVAEFCGDEDRFPNFDKLVDVLKTADTNFSTKKYALVGMGEYLVLRGDKEIDSKLSALWSVLLGSARVVVVLRFVSRQVENILNSDLRFKDQSRVCFRGTDFSLPKLVKVDKKNFYLLVENHGIKSLIRQLEKKPLSKSFLFSSELDLRDAVINVTDSTDSFSTLKLLTGFNLNKAYGNDSQWDRLLDEVCRFNDNIQKSELNKPASDEYFRKVFNWHSLDCEELESGFLNNVFKRDEYVRWLYFLMLKIYAGRIKSAYLRRVVSDCDDFRLFKDKFINEILSVPYGSQNFDDYYRERKNLLQGVSDADMKRFVGVNCVENPVAGMRCLTDNTLTEKEATICWISDYGYIPDVRANYFEVIKKTYPALASYMKPYEFDCGGLSKELTDYFNQYKRQKLSNKIDDDFLEHLPERSRKYARLNTRSNVFQSVANKEKSYLLWIDAMGVEFLSYIQDVAAENDLSAHIDIARADLPSVTEFNKGFYNEWDNQSKSKEQRLDEILHGDNTGQDYTKYKAPIYLASELEIIEKAIQFAKSKLESDECAQFIVASDHGASRLAVICEDKAPRYDTDTGGKHSGRCCEAFDCNIKNAADIENGYISLFDYGRFKGSKKAVVEVHGGATLEETLVPIITLTPKSPNNYVVSLVTREIKIDLGKGIAFDLYIDGVATGKAVDVKVHKDGVYFDREIKRNQGASYRISCPGVKRAGKYTADVSVENEKITSIDIDVKGATGSSNSGFDNLF